MPLHAQYKDGRLTVYDPSTKNDPVLDLDIAELHCIATNPNPALNCLFTPEDEQADAEEAWGNVPKSAEGGD